MNEESILIKTADGVSEMNTRALRLSQRHRTVLFLVDGKRSAAVVRRMAVAAGASEALLDELLSLRLVAELEPNPFNAVSVNTSAGEGVQPDIPLDDSLLPPLPPLEANSTAQPPVDLPVLQAVMEAHEAKQTKGHGLDFSTDDPYGQAKEMLIRALQEEAPVTGSLTLLRVRRAKSVESLNSLLDEVEQRISKPNRTLLSQQLMSNVKQLLILAASR
ncbi:MAG: hypothetical protein ACKOF9_09555 [Burkholderiales bacterium]